MLTVHHEVCTCGHCRCDHFATFQECLVCACDRYTWPGPGADLPGTHTPRAHFKYERRRRPTGGRRTNA